MRDLLEVSGSFVPAQGGMSRLASSTPGRVAKILVREGDTVQAGQLLATVDGQVALAQRDAAQAGAVAANQQADQARLTYQAAVADQASAVRLAEEALRTAQVESEGTASQAEFDYQAAVTDLKRIRSGARTQELAQARQATLQAQAVRDRARVELERNQRLDAEGYVAHRQLEDAKTALATAESALSAAEASESLLKEGARPEEIRAAEIKAASARRALANARKVGEQRVIQARVALEQARKAETGVRAKAQDAAAAVSLARQKGSEAQSATATAALGELRAPFSGRITRRLLNPGDFADTTSPLLEITQASAAVDFVASVPAEDAARIQPGMDVEIDGSASGRVVSLSPADPQTGLAAVRFATGAHASVGAFAPARIVLRRNPHAVAVPSETVLDRDGKTVVFRVEGEVAKMVEVSAGGRDGNFVAVGKEIHPGDVLVRIGQFELADGAKVKVQKQ